MADQPVSAAHSCKTPAAGDDRGTSGAGTYFSDPGSDIRMTGRHDALLDALQRAGYRVELQPGVVCATGDGFTLRTDCIESAFDVLIVGRASAARRPR
jgi:hypothetical protein